MADGTCQVQGKRRGEGESGGSGLRQARVECEALRGHRTLNSYPSRYIPHSPVLSAYIVR